MTGKLIKSFFAWYGRYYLLNISIAAFLFTLQIVHLWWLATDVIALRLFGQSFFHLTGVWYYLILIVDYTEIPALISTALIYVDDIRRRGYNFKSVLFISLLLSQLLHIFWITDEFVIEQFAGIAQTSILPGWIAWIAILIDYLEVPVIIDTIKKVISEAKRGRFKEAAQAVKERD